MSDTRHRQSVGDPSDATPIDRALSELLSVEPSPEFAAGVRRRIQAERASRPAPFAWWIGLASAAALALVVLLVTRPSRVEDRSRQVTTATPPADVVLTNARSQPPVERAVRARPAVRPATRSRAVIIPAGVAQEVAPEPEVLVPRDQLRAIARMQELIVSGALSEKDLPRADSASAGMGIQPAPLAIPSLTVHDVEVVTGPVGSGPVISKARSER